MGRTLKFVGLIINKTESDRKMIEEKLMDELRKLRRDLITAIDSPLNDEDGAHAFGVCLGSIDEILDRYSKPNATLLLPTEAQRKEAR